MRGTGWAAAQEEEMFSREKGRRSTKWWERERGGLGWFGLGPKQERLPIFDLLAKRGGAELIVMWAKIMNFA